MPLYNEDLTKALKYIGQTFGRDLMAGIGGSIATDKQQERLGMERGDIVRGIQAANPVEMPENNMTLGAIASIAEPIGDFFKEHIYDAEKAGDVVMDKTNNPLLATSAAILPQLLEYGVPGGAATHAARGAYRSVPKNFKQTGAIHGMKSNLFPDDWKGTNGKAWKMLDEGHTPQQIWDASVAETGFGIYPKPLYNQDGTFKRIDWKMNVPDINLLEGKYTVDKVPGLDKRQIYPATDFRTNTSMQAGYPDQYNTGTARISSDIEMLNEPLQSKLGKYLDKDKVNYRINDEVDYIPATEDSLLPKFVTEDQRIIQEIERFAPSGPLSKHKSAGNVELRAVQQEYETILDLRAKGMNNREVINYLTKESPIFKRMDTPNIFEEVIPRSELAPKTEPTGYTSNKYRKSSPPIIEQQYIPYETIKEVPSKIPAYEIEKIRFPTKVKKPKVKKDISILLDELINYV
ncbi:MAG: hypothetical protein DRQ35_00935 [Gammaproteobacteria bacterium]|nr:MAG: hypothetical protein DRQ35_00935 [Gammaproteobacteria bacterium]